MTDPTNPPLTPSDDPEAVLEAGLGTVTDDEFFDALNALPAMTDAETGEPVDPTERVRDERHPR